MIGQLPHSQTERSSLKMLPSDLRELSHENRRLSRLFLEEFITPPQLQVIVT
jgi:hypothetical protein